jgi:ADP-heptose:LPS heptosyltransferase/tetratricopeptide (TPR) repeat protein
LGRIGHLRTASRDAIDAADSARDQGRWIEAARKYREAVRCHEHRADLKVQLGNCLKEGSQYLDAYRAYLAALAQVSSSAEVYLQLGHLLKVSGNFFASRALYKRAAAAGNKAAAAELQAFQTVNPVVIRPSAGTADPDNGSFGVARPHLLGVLRHLARAEQYPADPESLRTAAYVLLDFGYRENARAFFELAFLIADRTPEAHTAHVNVVVQTGLWPADTTTGLAKAYWPPAPRQRLRDLVKTTLADPNIRHSTANLTQQALIRGGVAFRHAPESGSAAAADSQMPEVIGASSVPERLGEIIDIISQAYAFQFSAMHDDAAEFIKLIFHICRKFSDHPLFISFSSGDVNTDINSACSRTLLNCLSAWVSSSFHAYFGPFASHHLVSVLGMSASNPILDWMLEGPSVKANLRSLLEIINDILQDGGYENVPRQATDQCLAALLGTCVHAVPAQSLETMTEFLIEHGLSISTYLVFDQVFKSIGNVEPDRVVHAAQMIKHAGSSACASVLVDKFSNEDHAPVSLLCEKAIISKACGAFESAVRLFRKCMQREPGNLFYKHELWAILPEVETIADILLQNKDDSDFLDFASSRLNYRMHLRRWEFDDGEQPVSDDMLLHEIAPEIASEFVQRRGTGSRADKVQILQLGWRERIGRSAKIRELARIDVVRVKAVCDTEISGMRVRVDGRTIAYSDSESRPAHGAPAAGGKSFVFNCWIDLSEISRGLHEIQLVFEQRDSGYFTWEEMVFVNPEMPPYAERFSGTTVRLEGSGKAPLDERINGLPSAMLSSRRSFFSGPIKRVLVVRADQLGDFVTSIPALHRIKETFQGAELCCLVTPQNRELARSLDLFKKVFCINLVYDHATKRRFATIAEQVRLRREMKPDCFDIAIDLSPGSDTRPLLRLANARYTAGFKPDQFRWLSFGVDIQTRDEVNRKEAASHATLISSFVDAVAGAFKHRPRIVKSRVANWQALKKFGIRHDLPFVVLHSGARLHIKRWPVAQYVELARFTAVDSNLHTILFLEDPADKVFLEDSGIPPDKLHVITGPVTFEELDSLLSLCSVFVGNDTGPKHLAALRGVPVVSIHMGQVNWDEWGQEGDGVIITRNVPCYGCGIEDAEQCGKGLACLVHIKPREAYDAILSLLATPPGQLI